MGSVGQRGAKLPAMKLLEWFDPGQTRIQADWYEWDRVRATDFFLKPPTLTAGNIEATWPTDFKFLALKDTFKITLLNIKKLATTFG